jgi:hypothetical protein
MTRRFVRSYKIAGSTKTKVGGRPQAVLLDLAWVRSGRAAFRKVFGCPAGRLVQWRCYANNQSLAASGAVVSNRARPVQPTGYGGRPYGQREGLDHQQQRTARILPAEILRVSHSAQYSLRKCASMGTVRTCPNAPKKFKLGTILISEWPQLFGSLRYCFIFRFSLKSESGVRVCLPEY